MPTDPQYELDVEFLAKIDGDMRAAKDKEKAQRVRVANAEMKIDKLKLDNEIKAAKDELADAQKELGKAREAQIKDPFMKEKEKAARERVRLIQNRVDDVQNNLVRASKEGHLDEVRRATGLLVDPLDRKWGGVRALNVDVPDQYDQTALHAASTHGRDVIVETLISCGANVNRQNKYGRSALHMACIHGHTDVAKILIDAKATPNIQDEKGRTPLHDAALNAYDKVLDLILADERLVWMKTTRGWTPAHEAASRGHKELAARLMEAEKETARRAKEAADAKKRRPSLEMKS